MRRVTIWCAVAAAVWGAALDDPAEARCRRRCGCSDPYVTANYNYTSKPVTAYRPIMPDAVASAGGQQETAPSRSCIVEPVNELQISLVSSPVSEMRSVCSTEYRDEQRSRVVTGYKTVPVTEERIRVNTVMIPITETKTIEYTNQIAVQGEETKSYRIKVPVWEDQEETYTVKTPVLSEVEEKYTVKVPVLKDVPFNYTVNVPQPVTRTVTRTVSNVVPVVKTRTIDICVPVSQSKNVSVDRGHWENQFVDTASAGRKSNIQAHVQAPGQSRVWVPNVVNEETTNIVQQPQQTTVEYLVYEQHFTNVSNDCVCVEYRPEQRQGTKKEVAYQDEIRTRTRTAVAYQDEQRTRTKKVLTFREEEKTETYPVVTYRPERLTKDVSFTVYVPETKHETYTVTRMDQVPDHRIENYTVRVPVPVVKEVAVQVARMIPKVTSVTINPCGGPISAGQSRPVSVVPSVASASHLVSAPVSCCGGNPE